MSALGVHFALEEADVGALRAHVDDASRLVHVQEVIEDQFFESRPDQIVETVHAWDAIHRCLTDGTLRGTSGLPLEIVVLGGLSLYEGDDYIMALKLPAEVRSAAPRLASIGEREFRARYLTLDPNEYDGEIGDDDFAYTWEHFQALREFWARAAANGRSVLFTADQ